MDWTVLVAQTVEKANATVRSTLLALAGASVLAVTAALLSAFWMSRRMSRQVADFGHHMQAIANGDYTAVIPRSGTDEIELLAQSMRGIFTAAIGSALVAALAGFSLSVPFDLPSGPTIIAVSGALALASWGVRRVVRR